MQREIAGTRELRLELPLGRRSRTPGRPSSRSSRRSPRAAVAPVRRQRRRTRMRRRPLADGDEVACIPPVSGGAGERGRGAIRAGADPGAPRRAAPGRPVAALADRLATADDGGVVVQGRTRETPGTPAPGEEAEAARHAGRRVEALEYEAFEPLAIACWARSRTRSRRASASAPGHRPPTGEVPLGEVSVVVVAWRPIATPRSTPPDSRWTRRRRGRRSGRRSASPTATSGSGRARTGPAEPADRLTGGSELTRGSRRRGCASHTRPCSARGRPASTPCARAPTPRRRVGRRARRLHDVGPERAILRLFGVTGPGPRWTAARGGGRRAVRRPDPRRLAAGIALPFAIAMAEYDLVAAAARARGRGRRRGPRASRRSCWPSPIGARRAAEARRAAARPRWSGSTRTGPPGWSCSRFSATRPGRGSGVALGRAGDRGRARRGRGAIDAGADLVRVDVPASRELRARRRGRGQP